MLTIKYRNLGIDADVASDLNTLQIKVGELMGKLLKSNASVG
jgi:hypothetical protein